MPHWYAQTGKRLFDLLLVVPLLLLLSPVMLVVGIAARAKLGKDIVFRQVRPGLHGKPFALYKFRTMNDARNSAGELLPDAVRLTKFGQFLRSTSLDELPELWNILRGDMSFVGPRPLLMRYLDRYSAEQARRHDVKPGLTGWAQVNGRNAISWDDKFRLDVWYVDHVSFMLDLRILGLTLKRVIGRQDIQHVGEATMPEFFGNSGPHEM